MPSKYVLRNFGENSYYHIFNRGVEKRNIFLDEQDYNIFLYYLFVYLRPLEQILEKYPRLPLHLQSKNMSKELEIITYVLMPNHFHFLLMQKTKDATSRFMKQLTNAYTLYFNKKYTRVGGLVQGRFRAVLIETNELLLHAHRYIHLNPVVANLVSSIDNYKWSSYPDYTRKPSPIVCSKDVILSQFSSIQDYDRFLQDHIGYARELDKIKHLILEEPEGFNPQ